MGKKPRVGKVGKVGVGKNSPPTRPAGSTGARWMIPVILAAMAASAWAVSQIGPGASESSRFEGFEVVARYPHDRTAYTQGLYFHDGYLIEGTGRNGSSVLRRVEIVSGEAVAEARLESRYFGEGVAALDGRIYQLTWTSGTGFIYDEESFEPLGEFRYPGEGWGLTTDGEHLIMSEGTAFLRFMDPETFAEVRRVEVRGPAGPVESLNELEYVDGEVWANIWYSTSVIAIDPATGEVVREFDLGALYEEVGASGEAVLNGIAYDAEQGRHFITGKWWPTMFEVRFDTE